MPAHTVARLGECPHTRTRTHTGRSTRARESTAVYADEPPTECDPPTLSVYLDAEACESEYADDDAASSSESYSEPLPLCRRTNTHTHRRE